MCKYIKYCTLTCLFVSCHHGTTSVMQSVRNTHSVYLLRQLCILFVATDTIMNTTGWKYLNIKRNIYTPHFMLPLLWTMQHASIYGVAFPIAPYHAYHHISVVNPIIMINWKCNHQWQCLLCQLTWMMMFITVLLHHNSAPYVQCRKDYFCTNGISY